jgi:hypothetical protein
VLRVPARNGLGSGHGPSNVSANSRRNWASSPKKANFQENSGKLIGKNLKNKFIMAKKRLKTICK